MGGGSSSQTNITDVTSSVTNAMAQSIMNCSGNTMVEQKFAVTGSYNKLNNFKMVQAMNLSATCANNAENLASVQAAVTAAVTAASEAQSVAALGALGKSDSSTNVKIQNDVTQNITSQTITNIINSVNATQSAIISGDNNIISNFEEEQTLVILQNACQSVVSKMSTVQDIASKAEGSSKATQTDPISDLMNGISGVIGAGFSGANTMASIIAVVIIAVICMGGAILLKFGGQLIEVGTGGTLLKAIAGPGGNKKSKAGKKSKKIAKKKPTTEKSISENSISEKSISENSVSENSISENPPVDESETLPPRRMGKIKPNIPPKNESNKAPLVDYPPGSVNVDLNNPNVPE